MMKGDGELKPTTSTNVSSSQFIGSIEQYTLGDDFESYIERMNHLLTLNDVSSNEKKRSLFISLCGGELYKVLKSLVAPKKVSDVSYDEIITQLTANCAPKKNIISERYKFYNRHQLPQETISEYIIELKTLAQECDFKNFLDEALRDRFVCGIIDEKIKLRLLNEADLTFDSGCRIACQMEMTGKDMKMLKPSLTNYVENNWNQYHENKQSSNNQRGRNPKYNSTDKNQRGRSSSRNNKYQKNVQCYFCGKWGHMKKECVKLKNKIGGNNKHNKHSYGNGKSVNNIVENSQTNNLKIGSMLTEK